MPPPIYSQESYTRPPSDATRPLSSAPPSLLAPLPKHKPPVSCNRPTHTAVAALSARTPKPFVAAVPRVSPAPSATLVRHAGCRNTPTRHVSQAAPCAAIRGGPPTLPRPRPPHRVQRVHAPLPPREPSQLQTVPYLSDGEPRVRAQALTAASLAQPAPCAPPLCAMQPRAVRLPPRSERSTPDRAPRRAAP
jgi:hypothetical protein